MHDYQVSKFPILADKLKEAQTNTKKHKKSRKTLSKDERILVSEALLAGGTRQAIAKRFDVSEATVSNIKKEIDSNGETIEQIAMVSKPKKLTQCVSEVYESIESLSYEDKVRVLMSVTHLFDVHISVQL